MPIHALSLFISNSALGICPSPWMSRLRVRSLDDNGGLSVCADDFVRRNAG